MTERKTVSVVTVSSKIQVVIPKGVRQQMNIKVGQKLTVRVNGAHMELFPMHPMNAARGLLQGIDTHIEREEGRA
ncbi:AbrB/MazE/SpoVT family DNA-binding domain-containing protein [Methylophilus sp.]|uniref:AbrB/MazE/SpoVT family DNA-binding domain-containing protein n=1 Tax=Methylophilus sp. TaxID=29541 RepID=UPI0040373F83